MKFHPYAELFPLLPDNELTELAADIKAFGLREKIVRFDGMILDGRNRFLACQKAGVKPQFQDFKGTASGALAQVVSSNLRRRHLNESQRAMAAARIANLQSGQHADGGPIGPAAVSTQAAAQLLNTSERSTKRARAVLKKGSKSLQSAVDAGDVPVSRAAAVVDLPKGEQLSAAKQRGQLAHQEAKAELDEHWEPEENEGELLEAAEREYTASIEKVMGADDKLAAAHAEIKRQAAEIASLKLSRDGFQNGRAEAIRMAKRLQTQVDRLRRENEQLKKRAA